MRHNMIRILLLTLLSLMIYRNRHSLIKLIISVEGIRRLLGSMDIKVWLNNWVKERVHHS